jgi:hypothetical protein
MKRLILCLLLVTSLSTHLHAVSETEIKAVFLEKFTHLITWPTQKDQDFIVCVLNDNAFTTVLKEVYHNKTFKNRTVKIRSINQSNTILQCSLLFIGKKTKEPAKLLEQYADKPILTVSDNKEFVNEKVMITMYLKEQRFHYIINNKAATKANIKISYLLLKSAQEVIQ